MSLVVVYRYQDEYKHFTSGPVSPVLATLTLTPPFHLYDDRLVFIYGDNQGSIAFKDLLRLTFPEGGLFVHSPLHGYAAPRTELIKSEKYVAFRNESFEVADGIIHALGSVEYSRPMNSLVIWIHTDSKLSSKYYPTVHAAAIFKQWVDLMDFYFAVDDSGDVKHFTDYYKAEAYGDCDINYCSRADIPSPVLKTSTE